MTQAGQHSNALPTGAGTHTHTAPDAPKGANLADFKLGRLPMQQAKRAQLFNLTNYVNLSALPAPAAVVNWSSGIKSWPMDGNDRYGDCVVAAAAHQEEVITKAAGRLYSPAESVVERTYFHLTGGPDVGLDPSVMLSYWRKTGFTPNHKILAYTRINLDNHDLLTIGAQLFGGLQVAVNLPIVAQHQTVWDTPASGLSGEAAPGSWGGHMIYVPDKTLEDYTSITWGMMKRFTPRFLHDYGELAFAVIGSEWAKKPIRGFDVEHLLSDLATVGHGT